MTGKTPYGVSKIDSVVDLLIEDLSSTSDEELLKEAAEEFGDYNAEVERMRTGAQAFIKKRMQERLVLARQASTERKRNVHVFPLLSKISLDEKKKLISSLKSSTNALNQKVTMAARNESELTEHDLNVYLQSMYELGLIDENGKIL